MRRWVFLGSVCVLAGGCAGGGGKIGAGCALQEDCAALEFCDTGTCATVTGRSFLVVAVSGSASTGADWDAGGGAPDPFVVFSLDGEAQCATDTDDDTF